MGRKKLNRTKEKLDEMNKIRRNRYYNNHKKEERKKSLNQYYENKKKVWLSIILENSSSL